MATVLGRNLRRIRQLRGVTQPELAEAANVVPSYITNIEKGIAKSPSIEVLKSLADKLDVTIDELVSEAGEAPGRRRSLPVIVRETLQPVSAGPGTFAEGEAWSYYPEPYEMGHAFAVVRVSGTCMEPRIREGERVVVDMDASPRGCSISACVACPNRANGIYG